MSTTTIRPTAPSRSRARAGAVVRRETHQGKGHVVRRMFTDVEADIYVLVDGDATYDAPSARGMIAKLIDERLDMVVGARVDRDEAAYRPGHRAGNRLLTGFVAHMFGRAFTDILSGYRVFSRRFVKSFPVLSGGFEIETELTVHALELELPVGEMATPYFARPSGSASKLSTWRDGFRILWTVFKLYRAERPLSLFGAFGIALAIISIGLAIPIFITYVQEGLVPRLADRDAFDRADAACLPFDRLRADPRHRHARPARDSSCSPISPCARRARNGGGAERARACPHQRCRADLGDRGAAQRRAHRARGARSEHERAGRFDRHLLPRRILVADGRARRGAAAA